MSAATRQRRFRERRKIGVVPVTVEIDVDLLSELVERDVLTPDEAANPHQRAIILGDLLEAALRKA